MPNVTADNWVDMLYKRAAFGAKNRGIPFELSTREFRALVNRSAGRCELTGIEFSFDNLPDIKRAPWRPSLDRIDSTRGYTFDNCRLLCSAVNNALGVWPDFVLQEIAEAMTNIET